MQLPKLSFHPRLAAGLDLIVGLFLLWWISGNIHSASALGWWLIIRWAWWAVIIPFAYYPSGISRFVHFFTLAVFNLGLLGYLAIISSAFSWIILGAIFLIGPSLSFWLIPGGRTDLSFALKPFRRWRFLLSVISICGIWSGILALPIFQIFGYGLAWLAILAGSFFSALISIWWWREYGLVFGRSMYISAGVLFLLIAEFGAVLLFWPIGYLSSGFLLTWFWYVLWLMMRFKLSESGIDWKRQRIFLLGNAALITIYLFLIRWR